MMDQAKCIYFKSVSLASNLNGIRNLPKGIMVAGYLLMKFCFSSMLVTSCYVKKQAYERFRDLLKSKLKIKELGNPKHILGIRVKFVENGNSLSQRQYIQEIVHTFSFQK